MFIHLAVIRSTRHADPGIWGPCPQFCVHIHDQFCNRKSLGVINCHSAADVYTEHVSYATVASDLLTFQYCVTYIVCKPGCPEVYRLVVVILQESYNCIRVQCKMLGVCVPSVDVTVYVRFC